ncbi:hypothetical protein A4H97_08835 [Niastella yeongjuensis]|uniref:Uncharacterized protein n=1 Tax=Niastella yeongjuensis TaxID=354355 RepID=A0A1V9EEJ2_9BACT|nr:hypothetical protein [Niastella yeongjuensis]OQP44471.1 hypothetical protein A4H97_08835 [Niastella yeongjuensis]SEO86502.1 hypothetical protein SAMN05660816_03779 [Niastella yeongjuensis]
MTTAKQKVEPEKTTQTGQNNINPELKKELQKRDTDTAPDEFIGPDADTDVPLDGSVQNDAVLRGENHADEIEKIDKLPPKK